MFHLIQKIGTAGGRHFISAEYSTWDDAEKAAKNQLQNLAITEVMIVEAKVRVQRTMNVEVTKL